MAIVVIAVNTRVLLQFFPLRLPFALSFFTLSCFAPIPTGAWCVTLHIKVGEREVNIRQDKEKLTYARTNRSQHTPVGSGRWLFSCIFAEFGEVGK
jgi:hypothetical protein